MTDNNSGVLVIVEVEDSQPIDLALEMLALARRLTDNIGGTVTAVAFGTGLETIGEMLVAFGADQVLINDKFVVTLRNDNWRILHKNKWYRHKSDLQHFIDNYILKEQNK